MERPSGELGGLSTRGGSEGQVEHPYGDRVECEILTTLMDQQFSLMEEDQVRSKGWFRKFLEGLVQQRGQEHIPEVSGVTDDNFRSIREIVPGQCDEPLGSDVVLPVESEQFFLNLPKGTCPLVDLD